MLSAERTGAFGGRYEIIGNRELLTTVTRLGRRSGARFDLHGTCYGIRSHSLGRSHDLITEDGSVVAGAECADRRHWSVQVAGQVHPFRRGSSGARARFLLDADGSPVGSITRTGRRGGGAVGDLPGWEVPVQVFAVVVALLQWRRQRIAVAAVLGATRG